MSNLLFFENYLPPLGSGNYTIKVSQQVLDNLPKGGKIPDTTYSNTRTFAVTGPQYALMPDDFSSCYPPENAQGEFANALPHICFTRNTLPWERRPGRKSDNETSTPSWLGLLVFGQDELPLNTSQVTLLDLLDQNYHPKDKPNTNGKLPPNTLFPNFPGSDHNQLEVNQQWSDPCMIIDIPVDLFNAIAPSVNDLTWLSHVRKTQPSAGQSANYLRKLKSLSDVDTAPMTSTVLANRLPQAGSQNIACLVSFENWGEYLPSDDGTPSPNIAKEITTIRMVLLKQWSFFVEPQKETFSDYLINLNGGTSAGISGYLQLPPGDDTTPADKAIHNAFNMGYIPLNHHTRQGDQTVSWYKGPFVPYDTSGSISIPVTGSDSVTAYNKDTGMFDVSYSSAWQLGRLLALQNRNFVETLFNWKRENTQASIADFEEKMIKKSLSAMVEEQPIAEELSLKQTANKVLTTAITQFVNIRGREQAE